LLVVLFVAMGGIATASNIDFFGAAGTGSPACGLSSPGGESFCWNWDGGAAATGYLDNWGSPGVSAGVIPYAEAQTAFGLDITFTGGGTINAASVATGNASACAGTTSGGTTFCTLDPTDIWQATIVGPDSIDFLAQDPSFFLVNGQNYFVNIFFDGAAPTAFTGQWLTSFSPNPTPEPGTIGLLGLGLASVLALARKRKVRG
jgi:hypothetical protein